MGNSEGETPRRYGKPECASRAERRQGLGEGRVSGGKERAGGVAEGELERDASKKEGPTELRAGL